MTNYHRTRSNINVIEICTNYMAFYFYVILYLLLGQLHLI
jgi:hypothetical protein